MFNAKELFFCFYYKYYKNVKKLLKNKLRFIIMYYRLLIHTMKIPAERSFFGIHVEKHDFLLYHAFMWGYIY